MFLLNYLNIFNTIIKYRVLRGYVDIFNDRIKNVSVDLRWLVKVAASGNLICVWFCQTYSTETQVHAIEVEDLEACININ